MAVRNGLGIFVKTCNTACKILGVWKPSIVAQINLSNLTTDQKASAIATLNAIETSCDAFRTITKTWET